MKYPFNEEYKMALTKEQRKIYNANYWQKHKGILGPKNRQYYKNHACELNKRRTDRSREEKIKVLTHYGNDILACVACGEKRLACLTIDHIGGGGNKHRKRINKEGNSFYFWLIKNGR